ncbi:MAG: molybdenum cofactor biosynthesis protein MoaE [Planctomycetota bacterium]|jgi:molybdopterin synthase catalytic subunit
MTFRIVDRDLDPAPALEEVRDPACGAVATFVGTARRMNEGREVLRLEYEVLESMALRQFERLAAALEEAHGVRHVAIHHRRGVVEVGDVSVVIAVSAERRRDALAACAQAIESLKQDVPIWKKEVFTDGYRWVEGS